MPAIPRTSSPASAWTRRRNLFTIFGELKIPEDQKQAFIQDRTGTVIGRDLANKFNFHMGDRITLIGDIYPGNLELTVRGIFDSPRQSEMLYFNWAYVREGLPESRKGEVGTFDILCDSAGAVPRVARTIDDEFHNSPVQTRTETEQAFMLSFVAHAGQREAVPGNDLRGGDVHHPAGFRQHHGHVGARACARSGRAEDPGFHRREHPVHHSGRSLRHLGRGRQRLDFCSRPF